MLRYNILFKFFSLFVLFFFAQTRVTFSGGSIEQDISQVKANLKQAQELMNTNKNSQALELLEITGSLQEKIYSRQRDSASNKLNADFFKDQRWREGEIAQKQEEIKVLQLGNEDIDRENFKMIRNSLFFFGSLVGISVLLLLGRFRKLSRLKSQLILSESQLQETEKNILTGSEFKESAKKMLNEWGEVIKDLGEANPLLLKISTDKQHPLQKEVIQLQASTSAAFSVLAESENQERSEKRPVDLNQMIENVINQAYYHASSEYPEFKCAVVKDLEKILPKVELIPADIQFVLFNLLSNAFDAVREKRTNAPKGYEAKVTVSTRKLPRFVQIRVRDNGIGIIEKNPEQVFDAFYTSKNTAKHNGLGLTESKRIITAVYKGDLFIESDFTTGTDFIIRFPILTLM